MARGAQAIAEGLALGGYQYTTFKSKSEPSKLTRAAIVGGGGKRTQTAIDSGIVLAEAASWARDLVNEPGGSLTPPELAKGVAKEGERCGFEVTVWAEKANKRQGPGGALRGTRGER